MVGDDAVDGTSGASSPIGPIEFQLVGEFDLSNLAVLRELLEGAIASGANPIVLNMAGVGFIDSSGIGELIRARNLVPIDRSIVIGAAQPHIEKMFKLTGLSSLFGLE